MVGTGGLLSAHRRNFCFYAKPAILPSRLLLVVKPSSRRFKSCVRHFRYNKSHLNGGLLYLVGTGGFEPSASCSQSKRSTRLSYVPLKNFTFTIISDILLCSPRWFASLAFLLPQNRSTIKLHLSSKNLPPAAFSSSSPKQAQIATGGRSG